MAERMNYRTRDANGNYHRLNDVVSCQYTTDENGFKSADLSLKRSFDSAWDDVALNNPLYITSGRGDTAWEGRTEGIAPDINRGANSQGMTAQGYWTSTNDLTFRGTVGTSTTPEAMIATFLNSTYLPQLSTSTASLLTTGVTSATYRTGNEGTDNEKIGEVILALCDFGYAADTTKRVIPAVWENRILTTSAVTATNPTPDYIVRKKDVVIGGLRRSLSNVINRVVIRFKNLSGVLTVTAFNDAAVQASLAAYLGSASVSYVRSRVYDWSGLGLLNPTVVAGRAAALLNDAKQVKTDADSLEINRDYTIFSVSEGQAIPNWKVRAGKWLKISDRLPRATSTGSGSASGDAGLSNYYYLAQTTYDCFTGQLSLVPEKSSTLEDFIS